MTPHQEHHHEAGHDHEAADDHDYAHGHRQARGLGEFVMQIVRPHSQDAADAFDTALEASRRGIRAVKISFAALMATSLIQLVIVITTGSVALLADTIHNFSDALTAVPLFLAFRLSRRPANRRYTYGYRRAEDFAGLFIIAMITLSAIVAGWEAVDRLSIAIFAVLLGAVRQVWYRLMDAVDPGVIDHIEDMARRVSGVTAVHAVQARWLGHRLVAELNVAVDGSLTVSDGHGIAAEVSHRLLHEVRHLDETHVHIDPSDVDAHAHTHDHTNVP
jgi:divalent metal cation (Fe/Co/Zn/Cd) transporter